MIFIIFFVCLSKQWQSVYYHASGTNMCPFLDKNSHDIFHALSNRDGILSKRTWKDNSTLSRLTYSQIITDRIYLPTRKSEVCEAKMIFVVKRQIVLVLCESFFFVE